MRFSLSRAAACRRLTDPSAPQFPQDNGPMAHPIRPESYIAMDNFYTVTVYNKGAEVGAAPRPSRRRAIAAAEGWAARWKQRGGFRRVNAA